MASEFRVEEYEQAEKVACENSELQLTALEVHLKHRYKYRAVFGVLALVALFVFGFLEVPLNQSTRIFALIVCLVGMISFFVVDRRYNHQLNLIRIAMRIRKRLDQRPFIPQNTLEV